MLLFWWCWWLCWLLLFVKLKFSYLNACTSCNKYKIKSFIKRNKKNVKQRTKIIRKMSKNPIHHLKLAWGDWRRTSVFSGNFYTWSPVALKRPPHPLVATWAWAPLTFSLQIQDSNRSIEEILWELFYFASSSSDISTWALALLVWECAWPDS